MRKPLKGKDFMVFADGKSVALATNHELNLNVDTTSTSSKDSGLWSDAEVTGFNWDATSDSIGSPDKDTPVDISYEKLMELALAANPVPIILGIPKNQDINGVPEGGWQAPDGTGSTYFKGNALITKVSLKGQNGDNMTISATFTGVGKLEMVKTGSQA